MSHDRLKALSRTISLGRGEAPADLVLRNARLVNVLSGEIHPADIAVADGLVIGFGDYQALREVDCAGRFVCPGLIDGHIHIESTMLAPWEFARAAAPRGTCAVVWDPHEIANVLGPDGVELMLSSTRSSPLTFYVMVPSCVPATPMETAGGVVTAADITRLVAAYPGRVLGLAEVMNYPGVLAKDPDVLAKILACGCTVVDGHAPILGGKDLAAYILAGPGSDHECSSAAEAREKLRLGMHLLLREGSFEKNLADLLPVISDFNAQNISLACDDRDPLDLTTQGHMDHNVREAIRRGVAPVRAIQMASLNTARHYGLVRRGAVAPGFRADLVILDDLEEFVVRQAFLAGQDVADISFGPDGLVSVSNSVKISKNGERLSANNFAIAQPSIEVSSEARCIGIIPGQLITEHRWLKPNIVSGQVLADASRDIAKLAVVERHTGSGRIGLGFVQGLGLVRGAVAGTVAHDSHNLIIAGADEADMAVAGNALVQAGGGFAVALGGRVLALLPLPLAGLMSLEPLESVAARQQALHEAYRQLSTGAEQAHPFMILSFLALPVIPSLKLTDKGLFDVDRFTHVGLWPE